MEGPAIQLFVTCLVDALYPEVGRATVDVLEGAGCSVDVPPDQGCCGQPAFNAGLHDEARKMAEHTMDVLEATEGPVVVPSGSCASMIVHHYPGLFAGTDRAEQAETIAGRVRELTQFLVDDLDAEVRASCEGCSVAYHHSCHGLRMLGLESQADVLLESVERADLAEATVCCGFGGIFSVEMPEVSTTILDQKLDNIEASGAAVVAGGDVSCLMHIEGGLRRRGSEVRVRHIATLLGDGDE